MIASDGFRLVMRKLASGVTIVTTAHEGQRFGMTATSFTSVSLEPALVQVALNRSSRTHEAVRGAGAFAANILGAGQEHIAHHFSVWGGERFEHHLSEGATSVPVVAGAIGVVECRVVDEWRGGDHTVFVGEAFEGGFTPGAPLIYFQGGYRRLAIDEEDEP